MKTFFAMIAVCAVALSATAEAGGRHRGGGGSWSSSRASAHITQNFKFGGDKTTAIAGAAASFFGMMAPQPEGQKIIMRGGDQKVYVTVINGDGGGPGPRVHQGKSAAEVLRKLCRSGGGVWNGSIDHPECVDKSNSPNGPMKGSGY